MVEVKLSELRAASEVLTKILSKQVKFKLAYRLVRMTKVLQEELSNIEKIRLDLVKKYGTQDDKGNTTVKQDKVNDFLKELNTGLEEKVKLDIDLIPLELLEEMDVDISPIEITLIEGFIVKTKDEK